MVPATSCVRALLGALLLAVSCRPTLPLILSPLQTFEALVKHSRTQNARPSMYICMYVCIRVAGVVRPPLKGRLNGE